MYKSIRLATFKNIKQIDEELFHKINKLINKPLKWGEISLYSPTKNSFIEGTHENSLLTNGVFFSLKSKDPDSNITLASYLVNELDRLNLEYDWEMRFPSVRIFFDNKEMPLKDFDEVLGKPRKHGYAERGIIIGDSFIYMVGIRLKCQMDVFEELLGEILEDVSDLGYTFEIVFYF